MAKLSIKVGARGVGKRGCFADERKEGGTCPAILSQGVGFH